MTLVTSVSSDRLEEKECVECVEEAEEISPECLFDERLNSSGSIFNAGSDSSFILNAAANELMRVSGYCSVMLKYWSTSTDEEIALYRIQMLVESAKLQ